MLPLQTSTDFSCTKPQSSNMCCPPSHWPICLSQGQCMMLQLLTIDSATACLLPLQASKICYCNRPYHKLPSTIHSCPASQGHIDLQRPYILYTAFFTATEPLAPFSAPTALGLSPSLCLASHAVCASFGCTPFSIFVHAATFKLHMFHCIS